MVLLIAKRLVPFLLCLMMTPGALNVGCRPVLAQTSEEPKAPVWIEIRKKDDVTLLRGMAAYARFSTDKGILNLAINALADCDDLHGLDITGCELTAVQWKRVEEVSTLRVLKIGRTNITASQLTGLASADGLEVLDISGCDGIEWETGLFQKFQKLRSLALGATQFVGETSLFAIIGLSELRVLDVAFSVELNDSALVDIEKFGRLEALNITGCTALEELDDNMGLLPHLTTLIAMKCDGINSAGLKNIARCGSLTRLCISGLRDSAAEGFKELGNLSGLKELVLQSTDQFKGDHVKVLERLKKLVLLDLSYSRSLENTDLTEIVLSRELRELILRGCQKLTGGLIDWIASNSNLQLVNLIDCKGVVDSDLERLSEIMPKAEILPPPAR